MQGSRSGNLCFISHSLVLLVVKPPTPPPLLSHKCFNIVLLSNSNSLLLSFHLNALASIKKQKSRLLDAVEVKGIWHLQESPTHETSGPVHQHHGNPHYMMMPTGRQHPDHAQQFLETDLDQALLIQVPRRKFWWQTVCVEQFEKLERSMYQSGKEQQVRGHQQYLCSAGDVVVN